MSSSLARSLVRNPPSAAPEPARALSTTDPAAYGFDRMSATTDCQVLFDLFPSSRGRVALGRVKFGKQAPRIAILRELAEMARAPVARTLEAASAQGHPRLLKTWGVVHEGERAFVASEYVPAFCLAELLSVGRARQRGVSQAAAVRIAIQSLQLIEIARAALPGVPCRYLYADCLWVADFGEVLLAEPGLASALAGAGEELSAAEAEAQDVMSVAMALFQLSTGRLLTGDIAAAVKRELSVPLARVVEAALLGSELLSTAEGLKSALAGLPAVLVGDDPSVTAALGQLAGDLMHERKAKLVMLTRSSSHAEDDGPTRVYSGDDTNEPEVEEATVPLKPDRIGLPGRRVVRAPPAIAERALLPRARPTAPALAPESIFTRLKGALPRSLVRVERVLLYLLGVLIALVLVLSIARPERWSTAFEHVRALR